jgi:hypothetical protein
MKNYKYIGLFLLSLGVISCDVNNDLDPILEETGPVVQLNTNGLDFSSYVSIGASFTAGFTDNALFIKAQENSFPNILAGKFGTDFSQPLMSDNIGGLLLGGNRYPDGALGPRLYFNGAGPTPLMAEPTTETTTSVYGNLNNFGVPGAKSFHFVAEGYGNVQGVSLGLANPYFARMASSPTATVLGDAMAQSPTFFTLSEIGGNDVLGYALSGGSGVDQTGNVDPRTYGSSDITDPNVFASVFSTMVTTLTSNGAKGVIANVPYITNLAHFITVPYNPVPLDAATANQLNGQLLGPVIQILTALGQPDRITLLQASSNNKLLLKDESLVDFSAQISGALQQGGVPAAQAQLMGSLYGQARHATPADLFVLPLSSAIGTAQPNIPAPFNTIGVTYPLADKWVLTPQEQLAIKTATDAYNTTIAAVASANPNVALVDFKGLLEQSANGIAFDQYTLTTNLVTGGLISLDGVHLTGRGYALMANKILGAMDAKFGSNFTMATNGLAKADDHPTNYSPALR